MTVNISYAADFASFVGRIWFNCAHQGPLPQVAISAAREAIRQKATPHLISDEDFSAVPKALKASLARLIGAAPEDVILGNSASYGLHLLRNGVTWKTGDEVIVVEGDFPATIFPWLGLGEQGVRIRRLRAGGLSLAADEFSDNITASTRLLASSWVNSFSGSVLELSAIGQLCRERGIIFVVNGSQGVGALPINVDRLPIDALVCCGYKWLCGPYGTGFCWIRPQLRNQLRVGQTYWLPHVWGQESLADYNVKSGLGSEAFDVFCTANFFNFIPWRAAVEYLLGVGIETIEEHNRALVRSLIGGVDRKKYRLISPSERPEASAIVVLSYQRQERNREIYAALREAGIDIALRSDKLRFSMHVYNTLEEIGRATSVLNSRRFER